MADAQLSDLGSVVPDRDTQPIRELRDAFRREDASRRQEPQLRQPVAVPVVRPVKKPAPDAPKETVIVTPPPPVRPVRAIFAGDRPEGGDALGIDEMLAHLAELAAHKGARGPLTIGLLGGAGTGKSFALARLGRRIGDLAAAASKAQGPYLSRIHVQSVDAAALDGDPGLALAARLHAGLRQAYPDLAREVGASARDPHVVLRDAEERLDETRRRLDAERRALDEAGTRRARLTESVLYEASGSQIDAYARANRAAIESRLRGFGLVGEPVRNFKDLVQLVVGSSGVSGLAMRSLWAFKGQSKLLLAAAALVIVGFGLGMAIDAKDVWLGQLRDTAKAGTSVADWFQTHMGLLATAKSAAYLLALLALVFNVLRAFAFLRPIMKGARLLEADLDARRHDLDTLCAHQTKRVDTLQAEVDRLTPMIAEAERRAGGSHGARHEPSPFDTVGDAAQAQGFFTTLSAAVADGKAGAPQRIVLMLDHLDAIAPERACALLDVINRVAGPGLVTVAGFDPARLDPKGSRRDELERWIQLPYRLDTAISEGSREELVRTALGHGERAFAPAKIDAQRSEFDAPVQDEEAAMLAALAPLAGRTPRSLKRFAGVYLLARLGEERHLGALAFMLALAQGGTAAERSSVMEGLAGGDDARFDLPATDRRLSAALDAAVAVGGRFTRREAAEAAHRASAFSLAPSVLV